MPQLVVQAAKHISRGMGMVVLYKMLVDPLLRKQILAIRFHEKAAWIFKHARLYDYYAGQ
jgi:hypothetical protein